MPRMPLEYAHYRGFFLKQNNEKQKFKQRENKKRR